HPGTFGGYRNVVESFLAHFHTSYAFPAHPARRLKPDSFPAWAEVRNADDAAASKFEGTFTWTVTIRSPAVPPRFGTPRPRTRRVRPSGVPAGTFTRTGASNVGTLMVSPKVSSAKLTGTVTCRSSPSRVKTLSGLTLTLTKRSPDGVPLGPASPWP